jgi:hypothetical protein
VYIHTYIRMVASGYLYMHQEIACTHCVVSRTLSPSSVRYLPHEEVPQSHDSLIVEADVHRSSV